MFEQYIFSRAMPISPHLDGEWPGDRNEPIYWVAVSTIDVTKKVDSFHISVAADRHYEIYINGRLAAKQRNFFNGEKYVLVQQWDNLLSYIGSGKNTIEVVVRSDPWRNKNYTLFHPFLMVEGEIQCGSSAIRIQTDHTWSVSVIEHWRKQIATGPFTTHFDKVVIPVSDHSTLSGFDDRCLKWKSANLLKMNLPQMYLWNDIPVTVIKKHTGVPYRGKCEFLGKALDFKAPASDSGNCEYVLEAVFQDKGDNKFCLFTSYPIKQRIEYNGVIVYSNEDVASPHQLRSTPYSYLVPAAECVTISGTNTLKIILFADHTGLRDAILSFYGMDRLFDTAIWSYSGEKRADASVIQIEPYQYIGAKVIRGLSKEENLIANTVALQFKSDRSSDFAVLDMGEVVCGRLVLEIRSDTSGRIYMAYGFNTSGGNVDCQKMWMKSVDILEKDKGVVLYRSFDVRTFRYLDLVLEGFEGKVEITDIYIEEDKFVSSGEAFFNAPEKVFQNELWKASIHTAQLCSKELFMDNPEREHTQWVDDTIAILHAGYYVFGKRCAEKGEKALREFAMTQQPDGQMAGYAPGKWFPRTPLQCHTALFAMGCHTHFMYTGNRIMAADMLETILHIISFWETHRAADGLIHNLNTVFIDWGSQIYSYKYGQNPDVKTGALTAMNAYYLGVLRKTSQTAHFLGKNDVTEKLESIAYQVDKAIQEKLFDNDTGLFRDGIGNALAEQNYSQTANSLAVLYCNLSPRKKQAIIRNAFSKNPDVKIIPAEVHFARQAVEAFFEANCGPEALEWLEEGFGPMLKEGPGTIWEMQVPYMSQCQGAGAAPVYLLMRYLAGIYPMEPGYRKIGIRPDTEVLKELECCLETPYGKIEIVWDKRDRGINYRLKLPESLAGNAVIHDENIHLILE